MSLQLSLNPDGSWTAHDGGDVVAVGQGVLVYTDHQVTLIFHDDQGCTNDPGKGYLPPLPSGLCLNENDNENENSQFSILNSQFARWEGDHLVITGEGILQAYDIMGRQLFSREANSDLRLPTSDFPGTGVYVLRLEGQTQKIVIK